MTPKDDQAPARPADTGEPETKRSTESNLLEFLVCPITKESLTYARDRNELISRGARLAYPIVDGIPLMAPDAARELGDDETY
ncbi:MAG: Trm112 family protein [Pseudomonadota bacterium]